MRYGSKLAILTWLCTSGLALAAETAAPAPKLELHACTGIPGLPPEARCGTYEVWEKRTAKSGQRALDGLIAECEGDAACCGAFPRLREEIAAVLERAGKVR